MAVVERAYDFVLLGQCAMVAAVPFRSLFVAHQSVAWLTIVDTVEAVLRLGAVAGAIAMARTGGDGLVWICGLTAVAQGGAALAAVLLCVWAFPESRAGVRGCSRAALRELAGFTGWSALGVVSYRLRMSGMPMLLMRGFGSGVMGPFGLAATLAGYQTNLSSAIGRAAQPAMARAAGGGAGGGSPNGDSPPRHRDTEETRMQEGDKTGTDRERGVVVRLIPAVNRLATLAAAFCLVPLCLETVEVLRLWLGTGPDGGPACGAETPMFVRLMLVLAALPWMYMGYHAAIMADGRIRGYMTSAVVFEVVGLMVSAWLVWGMEAPAWSVPAVSVCTAMCAMTFWVWWIGRLLGLPMVAWWKGTWVPVVMVVGLGVGAALLPRLLMEEGLWRLVAVSASYCAVALPATWWIGMTAEERGAVGQMAKLPNYQMAK